MRADFNLETLHSQFMYEFADDIYSAVQGEHGFDDAVFPDFLGPAQKLLVPQRDTILHDLIRNVQFYGFEYSTGRFPESAIDYYRALFHEARVEAPAWLNATEVSDHIGALDRLLKKITEVFTPTVFHLLFSDRAFLTLFQHRVANYVKGLRVIDHPELLTHDGVIKRPLRVPTWLKSGVFHRDKGRCQGCLRDLTGLATPVHDLHLDHIIPLAQGGSNDPTNFQLTCAKCNLSKGGKVKDFPVKFAPYW